MEKIHGLTRRNIRLWTPCAPMVPPKHGWVVATTCDTNDPLFIQMPSRFAPWWKVLIFSMLCWRRTMLIYWDICRYICSLGTADEWLTVFHPLMNGSSEQWKWVCFAALVKSANRYNWYLNSLTAVYSELLKPSVNRRVNGHLRGKSYPVFLEYIVRERWDLYDPQEETEDNRLRAQYDPFNNANIYGMSKPRCPNQSSLNGCSQHIQRKKERHFSNLHPAIHGSMDNGIPSKMVFLSVNGLSKA